MAKKLTVLCTFFSFYSPVNAYNKLCLYNSHFGMSLQVLVLLLTSPLSLGGTCPACQIETPAGQRAAGRPTEGQPTGQPNRPQQHRQQLQPERQNHMRPRTADAQSLQQQKHRDELETTESWSVASLFT